MKICLAPVSYLSYRFLIHVFKPAFPLNRTFCSSLFFLFCALCTTRASAQCTPASINWDWQYKVAAFTSPAAFGLGVNALTMTWGSGVTSGTTPANKGFTGYGTGGYGEGRLAEFATRNGVITLTFETDVQNVKFAVYDLDNSQDVTVTALDGAASPGAIKVNAAPSNTNSRVSVTGNNTLSAKASGFSGSMDTDSYRSGVNFEIAGPVKTIQLAFSKTTSGFDPIWLSDVDACVAGDYPTGYQPAAAPEAGQPGFVIAAAGNDVYAIHTGTAAATRLFTDAARTDINSLAYDPYNQVFYYADGDGNASNKSIYKYDIKTCTQSTFIADVTAPPYRISLNSQGVGGGGAAFYNGSLFFGVDAGITTTEDNAIWRINLNAAGAATGAARVFSVQANNNSTSLYNWGDFSIYDGTLYNFSSAISPAAKTEIVHYNLNTQQSTAGYTRSGTGQVAVGYDGTVYNVTDGIAVYDKMGAIGTKKTISGDGWTANAAALDGAEYFKFPADFSDAPASYGRPFHQFTPCAAAAPGLLQLGATMDYEVEPAAGSTAEGDNRANYGGSGTVNDEDGISSFPVLALTRTGTTTAYALNISVRNTTGATRTLHAWIDFDGNGKFAAGEYASASVANRATTATLAWAARAAEATKAGLTYARFRITATALNDNAATPAEDERALAAAYTGEVEDYALNIDINLSGTVSWDANGLVDKQVNGTGLGKAAGTQLYAYLLSDAIIDDKATVGNNGAYAFTRAKANAAKTVLVSSANAAIGAPAPALTLPAGWVSAGKSLGTALDNSPMTKQTLTTGTRSLGDVNFGIQQLPVSNSAVYNTPMPSKDTVLPLTSYNELAPLSGTDPEDGALGATSTLVITSLAGMEGNELFYDMVLLKENSVIGNYDPELLAVKVKNTQSEAAAFDFAFQDAAGQRSAAPATYSVSFAQVLPLKLIRFEVKKNKGQATLQWVTAMEEKTLSFVVEHSLDGLNWTVAGSRAAAGNSLVQQFYTFSDTKPGKGTNFYRLKMLDLDGSFTYSATKALLLEEAYAVSCYPNPVSDKLYITVAAWDDIAQVSLTDTRGSRVYTASALPAGYIDMQPLPAGIYLLQLTGRAAGMKTFKVLKR